MDKLEQTTSGSQRFSVRTTENCLFPICTHDRSESKELSRLGEFNTSSHSRSFEDLRLFLILGKCVYSQDLA